MIQIVVAQTMYIDNVKGLEALSLDYAACCFKDTHCTWTS